MTEHSERYAIIATAHPTLEEDYAGTGEMGTTEWSRDHLIRFHGWAEEQVNETGGLSGEHHSEDHFAREANFPIPHTHVPPPGIGSLQRAIGALAAFDGGSEHPADETRRTLEDVYAALKASVGEAAISAGRS